MTQTDILNVTPFMKESKQSIAHQERPSPDVVDLLATTASNRSFSDRIRALKLSSRLEKKVLELSGSPCQLVGQGFLSEEDEGELATEVLRHRHLFTESLLSSRSFRQAALTVIQNIYLFRNRKIFFGTTTETVEQERQEALLLFSGSPERKTLPLAKTFQHLIIARVWRRITWQAAAQPEPPGPQFDALQEIVEKLNTLRNVYMLLSSGLVKKLARNISTVYRDTLAYEDAIQVGQIGIARAAYRYHPSCGLRFSTFATGWINREIQRQALEGRLIRNSTGTMENYSKAARTHDAEAFARFSNIIENATTLGWEPLESSGGPASHASSQISPPEILEANEIKNLLLQVIDQVLSEKHGDMIKRRYGLGPYKGKGQSIISISKTYGVTRSSIYQLEQTALKKLQGHISALYRQNPRQPSAVSSASKNFEDSFL